MGGSETQSDNTSSLLALCFVADEHGTIWHGVFLPRIFGKKEQAARARIKQLISDTVHESRRDKGWNVQGASSKTASTVPEADAGLFLIFWPAAVLVILYICLFLLSSGEDPCVPEGMRKITLHSWFFSLVVFGENDIVSNMIIEEGYWEMKVPQDIANPAKVT